MVKNIPANKIQKMIKGTFQPKIDIGKNIKFATKSDTGAICLSINASIFIALALCIPHNNTIKKVIHFFI